VVDAKLVQKQVHAHFFTNKCYGQSLLFFSDSLVVVEIDDEIIIENDEPFIATNEWQKIKPGKMFFVSSCLPSLPHQHAELIICINI
jgi:hypothetical protein